MELLVIKSRNQYFRFTGADYETCSMNKASVFPLEKLSEVKNCRKKLKDAGIDDVAIYRLTIIEELFME